MQASKHTDGTYSLLIDKMDQGVFTDHYGVYNLSRKQLEGIVSSIQNQILNEDLENVEPYKTGEYKL